MASSVTDHFPCAGMGRHFAFPDLRGQLLIHQATGRPVEEFLHLVKERLAHQPSFQCFGGHFEVAPPVPRFWDVDWDTCGP